MGRLTELLLNEASLINKADITKTSGVGNLFKLLLIDDALYDSEYLGSTFINTMLKSVLDAEVKGKNKTDISKKKKQKTETFGKLKVEFNKKVVKLKKNEKPKKFSRNIYFGAVLKLLSPYIKSKQLAITKLLPIYKAEDSIDIQRITTAKIGKDLLNNQDIELTQIDKQFIKDFISNHDAAANITKGEEETKTQEEPVVDTIPEEVEKNPVEKLVSKEKTPEELTNLVSKSEAILDEVKSRANTNRNNVEELKIFLKENTTADAFKISLYGQDEHLTEKYNSFISSVFDKVSEETNDLEIINFVGKHVSNHLKELSELGGYLTMVDSNGGQPHFDFYQVGKNYILEFGIKVSGFQVTPHDFLGTIEIKPNNDGTLEVETKDFQVPIAAQGTGVAKEMFIQSLDLYKAADVSKITLEANVDVGGYAWFRYGFIPNNLDEISKISQWIEMVSDNVVNAILDIDKSVKPGQQTHSQAIALYIKEKTFKKNITPAIENLVSLIEEADPKKIKAVIPTLFYHCADEFKKRFNNESTFKDIGEYIAINNFKEKTISGKKYTISYKALLSIQAANTEEIASNGSKILNRTVPMTGGVYISWNGTLDMNDLDDTYAYLNFGKDKKETK